MLIAAQAMLELAYLSGGGESVNAALSSLMALRQHAVLELACKLRTKHLLFLFPF